MATHHQPRSDKSFPQPITDQLQEANSLEASSSAHEFVAPGSVPPGGKALSEKLLYQINHDRIDITLVQVKGEKGNG